MDDQDARKKRRGLNNTLTVDDRLAFISETRRSVVTDRSQQKDHKSLLSKLR
jgi:uncharacterized lipoprotein YbaY